MSVQPVVVIPGVDHDGNIALPIKEDVRHPLPDAGNILVDPAGIQRLAESREIRSYFIRGAVRTQGLNYPNREWGYGRLNLEETFNALLRV